MPARYAIANWKMNLPPEGIETYLKALGAGGNGAARIVVAPPFLYLKDVVSLARSRVAVGGQNCADQPSGPLTGEVSAPMLRECGAEFVIIGHSERRTLFGETDAMVARKLGVAIESGLTPILCIGEDQKIRDAGEAGIFVSNQVKSAAVPPLQKVKTLLLAYEPVWAIGTGRNATGAMVREMVTEIRSALERFWPSRFVQSAPILYGGSVTPDNVADLAANGQIDGYLVGGASLDSRKFLAITTA
ncbi:MAG: triose-phosphate isomerase [Acidobacteria bacterium]|nr:MAG: triose-phosphate isomerase [Acidobacteriota bacterium]